MRLNLFVAFPATLVLFFSSASMLTTDLVKQAMDFF